MHEGLGAFLFKALLLGAILLMAIFNFIQIESLERRLRAASEQQSEPRRSDESAAGSAAVHEEWPEGTVREGNLVILPSGIVLVPTYPDARLATLEESFAAQEPSEAAFEAQLERLQAELSDEEAARLRELIAQAQRGDSDE